MTTLSKLSSLRHHGVSLALAVVCTASSAFAQTVVLDEQFDSCLVPPAGWSEENNGATAGWEDDACTFAFHDDFTLGLVNANRLVSPPIDISGLSEAWLHMVHTQVFAMFADVNTVEVSVDGGVNWVPVWTETAMQDGTFLVEVDLSSFIPSGTILISYFYGGEFANEWRIDQLVVDDQAPFTPPYWPNIPLQSVSADGYFQTFDTLNGVVPDHMAINSVDAVTRKTNPLGWTNIGQLATNQNPRSGQAALEMGLDPTTTAIPLISNALVIGLNGAGVSNFIMDFWAIHYGEELNADDGVFVSTDASTWYPVVTDWEALIGPANTWTQITCDLSSTPADVSGDFLVAFAQSDNAAFGTLDGLGIDDISIGGTPPLLYDVQNFVAGSMATFTVTGADPSSVVVIGYSLTGAGPTTTLYGLADLSDPIEELGKYFPNGQGEVVEMRPLPPMSTGIVIYTQALEVTAQDIGIWSNSLALTIQ